MQQIMGLQQWTPAVIAEHHPGILQAAFKWVPCCEARLPDALHLLLHGLQLLLFCSTAPKERQGSGTFVGLICCTGADG